MSVEVANCHRCGIRTGAGPHKSWRSCISELRRAIAPKPFTDTLVMPSLRDYFAAAAMTGLIARPTDGFDPRVAYAIADTMLIARERKEPPK